MRRELCTTMSLGLLGYDQIREQRLLVISCLTCSPVMLSVLGPLILSDVCGIDLMARHYREVAEAKDYHEGGAWVSEYAREIIWGVWVILFLMFAISAANLYVLEKGRGRKVVLGGSILTCLAGTVIGAFSSVRLVSLMKLALDFMSKANNQYLFYLGKSCYWRLFWALLGTVAVSLSLLCTIVVVLIFARRRSQNLGTHRGKIK